MTEFVAALEQGMRAPCRDAFRVRGVRKFTSILRDGPSALLRMRGDGAPKSAKSLWLVPCGTRAPSGAPITACCGIGPCFRPVRRAANCADRSVSQLLAGTPSGPGGSSNAARVPRCDEARRRRTPSRLTTPHEAPLNWTRWVHHKRGSGGGDYAGITHLLSSSRRKPGSRSNRHGASGSGYRLTPV